MSRTLRIETAEAFRPLLDPARYKGAYGGRGSGKSHFFADHMIERALMDRGFRGLSFREVQKSLKESAKRLLESKLEEFRLGETDGFKVFREVIETPGDGIIMFQGMQDHTAESIKSLEGIDVAWGEEAQSISSRSLQLLRPTIRKDGSELWFGWNPRRKIDPVDALLRGNGAPTGASVVSANWRDNPWFPGVLEQERLDCLRDEPGQYDHIWEGGYATVFQGAYYAKQFADIAAENRICTVRHEPAVETFAAWDLGIGDAMALWVGQAVGKERRFLRYYENSGEGLDHYIAWLKALPFPIDYLILPHDAEARELQTGKSRKQFLEDRGFRCKVVPRGNVDDGINAVRSALPNTWLDAEGCDAGIEALRSYRAEFDEKNGVLKSRPLHDWASHGADAFRCGIMGIDERAKAAPITLEDMF